MSNTSRTIPSPAWGSAYAEEVELPAQQYACASCGQVAQIIVMISGTIYCKEHRPQ